MFGGSDNSNLAFPVFMEENLLQFQADALPQLQPLGDFPFVGSICPLNDTDNENATAINHPVGRVRGPEPAFGQPKLQICLDNNFRQHDAKCPGPSLKQNPVSTGLKLSCEEEKCNSSITSASECMKSTPPGTFSFSNCLRIEIDHQTEVFDHYIRLQEANIMKGIKELQQRHTASFLQALDKGIGRKLQEKELEIQNVNCKNKELEERIKQVAFEAQTWQYRANYNESLVTALKSSLWQVINHHPLRAREGCGDSEEDDVASHSNENPSLMKALNCRSCKQKEVSILLLPCRHLCLCKECERFVPICPICQVMKTASFQVCMPL